MSTHPHSNTPEPQVSEEFTRIEFSLGDKLRKLRTSANLSQEVMAQLLGVNRNTVLHYETGKIQDLKPAILLNWCVHTGGRPSEILGGQYVHLDERALQKIIEIRRRRVVELAVMDGIPAPADDDPFSDILALEDGPEDPTDPPETFTWKSEDPGDDWVLKA